MNRTPSRTCDRAAPFAPHSSRERQGGVKKRRERLSNESPRQLIYRPESTRRELGEEDKNVGGMAPVKVTTRPSGIHHVNGQHLTANRGSSPAKQGQADIGRQYAGPRIFSTRRTPRYARSYPDESHSSPAPDHVSGWRHHVAPIQLGMA